MRIIKRLASFATTWLLRGRWLLLCMPPRDHLFMASTGAVPTILHESPSTTLRTRHSTLSLNFSLKILLLLEHPSHSSRPIGGVSVRVSPGINGPLDQPSLISQVRVQKRKAPPNVIALSFIFPSVTPVLLRGDSSSRINAVL